VVPGSIESVEVSLHLHATEDVDKVLGAVEGLLGVPVASFSLTRLEGHFGNVIVSCVARLSGDEGERLLSFILSRLNALDRTELRETLDRRLERDFLFYLRLDKQEIVRGRVKLGERDSVKFKFKFSKHVPQPRASLLVLLS
jgi:RNA binding exosome subunit